MFMFTWVLGMNWSIEGELGKPSHYTAPKHDHMLFYKTAHHTTTPLRAGRGHSCKAAIDLVISGPSGDKIKVDFCVAS